VLYEKLAKRPPYIAESAGENVVMDILSQVQTSSPPPLRAVSHAGGEAQRVSRRLEGIVGKAMARDPQARYATAADFAQDLRRYLDRRPTSVDRSRFASRMRSWFGGPLKPVLAAAFALLVLLGRPSGASMPGARVLDPLGPPETLDPQKSTQNPTDSRGKRDLAAPSPRVAPVSDRTQRFGHARALRALRDAKAARGPRRSPPVAEEFESAAVEEESVQADEAPQPQLAALETISSTGATSSATQPGISVASPSSNPLPAPAQLAAPSANDPFAFIQRAQRDPSRLARVDLGPRQARAYCLVNAKGNRALECLHQPLLSPEAVTVLAKAHKRSGIERIWTADSGGNVVRACQTLTPPGSFVRRPVCSDLSIKNLLPPPGGLLRIDSTRLAVASK
jgi:serine/threonine protein kinase